MVAHPAPEVRPREALVSEIPRGCQLVLAKVSPAWTVRTTYGRGTSLALKLVSTVVLRLRRPGQSAVAVWEDGSFAFAWQWWPGENPQKLSARELKALAASEDLVPPRPVVYADGDTVKRNLGPFPMVKDFSVVGTFMVEPKPGIYR